MNFANGAVYMLGGYLTVIIFTELVQNFWLALLGSIIITGFVGFSVDRFALDILRKKSAPPLAPMITTMGISTCIENAIMVFLGSRSKPVPYVANLGFITIGNVWQGNSPVSKNPGGARDTGMSGVIFGYPLFPLRRIVCV
jgi:branched-chain amino acid transport system permease protein